LETIDFCVDLMVILYDTERQRKRNRPVSKTVASKITMSIFIPKGRDVYYCKFEHQGRQHFKMLDTRVKRIAEVRARKYRDEVIAGNWTRVDELRSRSAVATIGDVVLLYQGPASAPANVRALLQILRTVHAGDPLRLSSSVLTRELVREYQRRAGTRPASINSMLRQARAVFSKRAMEDYESLTLPDLDGFMNASGLKVQKLRGEFVPIPAEVLAAIGKMVDKWRGSRDDLVAVYLLARYLGMRNVEIAAARWGWVERTDAGADMVIRERADQGFAPKGYAGRVPIGRGVLRELDGIRGAVGPDDHIVPAATATDRHGVIYRSFNEALRPHLPGRQKCLYELRKQAGSEVFTEQGLAAAQEFLRHADIGTTKRWYATLLNPVRPLGE
jgi:integrase